MANMNLYSRGDKFFVYMNMALIALFTLSTLYPFIYITAVSFSDGSAAIAGTVVYRPIATTISVQVRDVRATVLDVLCEYVHLSVRRDIRQLADHHSWGICAVAPAIDRAPVFQPVCCLYDVVQRGPDPVLLEHA